MSSPGSTCDVLIDLQDVCLTIETLATFDLSMIVDAVGIFEMKGSYCTLTMTNWFLQALLVIPRGMMGRCC
ncbi:3-phosphoshikimate 1-carboxyvinyltransferase [Dorcoceras hygrometricum]|uniref:3-phosphoshikimate 1-carboxyvinyltransferase n=1 Tax=Dorcoceras hygrometricum TaxID=472368 RepID=A0A2Z7AP44_9LAMI|nr:3-phosphoshikimate 1-carboxyvinyltransferase [Dorcoceras hygrometricum]